MLNGKSVRHLTFIFFLCFAGTLSAQHSSKLFLIEKPTQWLESKINGFEGTVLEASDNITYLDIDSVKKTLYTVVSNEKNSNSIGLSFLMAYGIDSGKVLWIREFLSNNTLLRIDTLIALTGNGTMALNQTNGKEIWSSSANLLHYSKKYNMVLGYDNGATKLVGLDAMSGKIVWHDFINKNSLKSLRFLGDTGIVIMGENLRHYSFERGKEYNTEAKVRNNLNTNDTTPLAAVRIALMASWLSDRKGYNSEQSLGHKLSNLIIRNAGIYLASGNAVYAFTLSGDLRWQFILSRSISGLSKIFYYNERIYIVKYGIETNQGQAYFENLYIGIIDPETGDKIKSSNLNQTHETFIKDFLLTDTTMIVAMNNRLVEVTLDDLRILSDKTFGHSKLSAGFRNLIQPPYFVFQDDILENRSKMYPERIFVENNNNLKIELSKDFQPLDVIPKSRFFQLAEKYENLNLLYNDTRVMIANDSLQMYPIRFSRNMLRVGGYFCDWNNNRIILISEQSVIDKLKNQ